MKVVSNGIRNIIYARSMVGNSDESTLMPNRTAVYNHLKRCGKIVSFLGSNTTPKTRVERVKTWRNACWFGDLHASLGLELHNMRAGVSASPARNETKLQHFHPHTTTMINKFYDADCEAWLNCVNCYLYGVRDGEIDSTLDLFNHEAWLHLSGYVSCHCNRYWYVGSSQWMSRGVKIGVWCAMSATRIARPISIFVIIM
jgi:hypothetical protein